MVEAKGPLYLPLYKKWTRAKGTNYFCTVSYPWFAANKISVEVGMSEDGTLTGVTKVWTDGFAFASWLHQFVADHLRHTRPTNKGKYYAHYGGAVVEGRPIARVLDVGPLAGNEQQRSVIRVAHLVGVKTEQGAFIPKTPQEVLSNHSIQMTVPELVDLSYRLDHCYSGYFAALFLGHGDDLTLPTEEPNARGSNNTFTGELFRDL